MGDAEGCSMLYLEARCLAVMRAAGSQGVQNGAISCVALVLSVPGGTREILAENLLAAWLDLEVASGNDAIASHSPTRRTGKLMGQFLPGTDFVTSGYSVMPRRDNMFGGGNYDADDIDEWLTLQRDWQVDAGIEPAAEERRAGRARARRAARSRRSSRSFGLPGRDATPRSRPRRVGRASRDLPDRDRAADVDAADRVLEAGVTVRAGGAGARRRGLRRRRRGHRRHGPPARQRPTTCRRRRSSTPTARCTRPSTTPTATAAPARATGWRASAGRSCRRCRTSSTPRASGWRTPARTARRSCCRRASRSPARAADEVVLAVGPAFGDVLRATIAGLPHEDVLAALLDGVARGRRDAAAREGARTRPTSPSSATAARGWPAPASRSACSRRARRSSTASTCSRSTTWSCSAWRRC